MKKIYIYDTECDRLEEVADLNGMSVAEVIEMLVDGYLDEMVTENELDDYVKGEEA